ncbi:hypothetical protein CC1G_15092 [Coprinopsis cinerea okayama7|uniref:Uncharacterized protein n=1 Tax=Coprinopsis cinerea (strain Okayama-7 / 130 / ATCC MYA-4618 / FGSC 9003) TaxID=240176 RepID=D6RPF9_COPC7|nr:hypothetical protein CC1G_15092 [Coprinopsis cinerea okayama7\|eukprot:XP_002910758.1 hypothetical protein CC1G_15092 [Coprinopsis cinerea okayama7\
MTDCCLTQAAYWQLPDFRPPSPTLCSPDGCRPTIFKSRSSVQAQGRTADDYQIPTKHSLRRLVLTTRQKTHFDSTFEIFVFWSIQWLESGGTVRVKKVRSRRNEVGIDSEVLRRGGQKEVSRSGQSKKEVSRSASGPREDSGRGRGRTS